MTVKEFYDAAGGGYEEMLAKFSSDATITAFLKIFKRDTNYAKLLEMLDADDTEGAFQAAHTFKGVVLNLNIVGLIDPVCNVVEALRAGNIDEAKALAPALKQSYDKAWNALIQLLP